MGQSLTHKEESGMGKSPKDNGGPVVETGPTAGKNRSRNKNGRWREKRSDSGKPREKKSGCFLTTAACQHKGLADNCQELTVLRSFRDNYLMETREGRCLVERYYQIAPGIVNNIQGETELEMIWTVIRDCVGLIEADKLTQALDHYKAMTESLEEKYLI